MQIKSQFSSASTRALLLSTYLKWANVFPEIKTHVINVFERYQHVLDSELQQRACEYLIIAKRPEEDELLPRICEEMPPFPERESTLLSRLNAKHLDTGDKRTWVIGGKEANQDRETVAKKFGTIRRPAREATAMATDQKSSPGLIPDVSNRPSKAETDPLTDLAGLNISSSNGVILNSEMPAGAATFDFNIAIDRWFERLTYSSDGILFEDVQIQIGVKSEFHGHLGRVALYFGNKMSQSLTSFTATVDGVDPDVLSVSFAKIPQNVIHPTSQSQQLLQVECKNVFTTPPILQVSFMAGSLQTHRIRLPIVLSKFFEPVKLSPEEFFERWKIVGGPPREAQEIYPIGLDHSGDIDYLKNHRVVVGSRFQMLQGVDPNPINIVAAGVLHSSTGGKVGCLIRVEPNKEAKVMLRLR